MPHWFECFAEKKTIFKDSKDSPQALKMVYNINRNYDELIRYKNEIFVYQRHIRVKSSNL